MLNEKYVNTEGVLLFFIILGLIRVFLGFQAAMFVIYGVPFLIFIVFYIGTLIDERKLAKERE